MTAANIIGITNFFIKSRKLSMVLLGMQLGYLIYKASTKKSKKANKALKE